MTVSHGRSSTAVGPILRRSGVSKGSYSQVDSQEAP